VGLERRDGKVERQGKNKPIDGLFSYTLFPGFYSLLLFVHF